MVWKWKPGGCLHLQNVVAKGRGGKGGEHEGLRAGLGPGTESTVRGGAAESGQWMKPIPKEKQRV